MPIQRLFPAIVALAAVAALAASPCAPAQSFDLQGHRGSRGHLPENTLPAFEKGLAIGVTTLETDAVITRDGVVALGHDPRLNPDIVRRANGEWLPDKTLAVSSLTWAELQGLDVGRIRPGTRYAETFGTQQPRDGTRMPRLADLFALVKASGADHVRFDIETKMSPLDPGATLPPEAFVRALLAVVNEHGMARRTQVQSFDWRTLRIIKRVQPEIETMCLTSASPQTGRGNAHDPRWTDGLRLEDHRNSIPALVKAASCDIWAPNFAMLNAGLLAEARQLGLRVIPWTINEPDDIDRVLALRPDGIISDYPDRVRAAMPRFNLPLPPAVPAASAR